MDKVEKQELEKLMAAWGNKNKALSDSSSDSGDSGTEYATTKKKKKKTEKSLSKSKTRRTFFEKELKLKDKGAYQVWKSEISVLGRKIHIFLHAVNDSKIVYRISTRYEPQRHKPVRRREPISENTNRFLPSNSKKPEILVEKIIISKNFSCRREPVHPVTNETFPI